MQNGELARSTQRLIQMLRPENVGTAAQTAMTWFKPQASPSGPLRPIRLPGPPATLGRLGILSYDEQVLAAQTSLQASFVPKVSDVAAAVREPATREEVEREEA